VRLVFCCVGALAIAGALHHVSSVWLILSSLPRVSSRLVLYQVDAELLGWWLCERQLPNGGLNGRPEKLEDVTHCVGSVGLA